MYKLKKIYTTYKKVKFPPNQIANSDIFARLVMMDGDLAGLVSSLLKGHRSNINLSQDIKLIEQDIKELDSSQITIEVKSIFLNYIDKMKNLNDAYMSFFEEKNF